MSNYLEKCPVQIWKRYIPLLIDRLISNNFSSMTFFLREEKDMMREKGGEGMDN